MLHVAFALPKAHTVLPDRPRRWRRAQRSRGGFGIRRCEDRVARDEDRCTGGDNVVDVRAVDAAVDLDVGRRTGCREQRLEPPHLVQAVGNEGLASKPGLTDITRTKSRSLATSSSELTGVEGLITAPALTPRLLM